MPRLTVASVQSWTLSPQHLVGQVGEEPGSDDDLPTTHLLKPGDCVYLLPTGRTTRVNDMRLCKPVVVSEIRIPPTTDKAPVIVAFVFLRHDHDWLTKVRLGFPPCHIGEGELVLTTTPIVEEITRIASTANIIKFDEKDNTPVDIDHTNYWCRYVLDTKRFRQQQGPLIGLFDGPYHNPGARKPIVYTCLEDKPHGLVPYSPNEPGTHEILCVDCERWFHVECCVSEGEWTDRWKASDPLLVNLKRAPILRGRWWSASERSDWMLGGSGRFFDELPGKGLPDDASADDINNAMHCPAIIEDYPEFECEWFLCPICGEKM